MAETKPNLEEGTTRSSASFFEQPLSFEISSEGLFGVDVDLPDTPLKFGDFEERDHIGLPEISEPMCIRHFTRLSTQNFSIDTNFYPLGSCTMKYNPRVNEKLARLPDFAGAHPLQPIETIQGSLELMYNLQNWLSELSGLPAVCLSPAAGAHGELAGVLVIKKALESRGEKRKYIIVSDSAHGTNPATAAMLGFSVISAGLKGGLCDPEEIEKIVQQHGTEIAGLMLTNPSTCGLFEKDAQKIADTIHSIGGYFYCDGANFNAIVGKIKPADFGADIMHFNLHKTFSTPHGGGGPGCGPIACTAELSKLLPPSIIEKDKDGSFKVRNQSGEAAGKLKGFMGQFLVMVRAYAYMITYGIDGLRSVAEDAVLSANYMYAKLREFYDAPYYSKENSPFCMHEFIITDATIKKSTGVTTLDIAKALIDKGFHPMTVFFPIIISGVMLVEPTETESKKTLDDFIDAMIEIAKEANSSPEKLKKQPSTSFRSRLDEFLAAKSPLLTYDEVQSSA